MSEGTACLSGFKSAVYYSYTLKACVCRWKALIRSCRATYWTLQDLGDPLLLLHHVEVLPQVRRHVPAAEVLGVTLVQAVDVALLGVVAGQGQGERPRRLPHLHQTHVFTARPPTLPLGSATEDEAHIQAVKATKCCFNRKDTVWVLW